jgi:hypothetical protein
MYADTASLTGSLDYRRSPNVFTSNALQGQGVLTMKERLKRYRLDEVETFALDRTARATAACATPKRRPRTAAWSSSARASR